MDPFVSVRGLSRHFAAPRRLSQVLRGERPVVRAVDGIDLAVADGETVGVLGESGCGKTTTGRLLLKLVEPSEGSLRVAGSELAGLSGEGLRRFRRTAQFVFQNPFDALNPRLTIGRSMAEPLQNLGIPVGEREERILRTLERVRVAQPRAMLERHPHELSGGQLQRVVLARALVVEPRFIVADEPVSMLDVSVRAGILNLLRDLQGEMGLTALYISHDLALVRYVAQRTVVMYLGRIVEDGPTEDVIHAPLHPYTQALVAAVPIPHVGQSRAPLPLRTGGGPAPSGDVCRFASRCPHVMPVCTAKAPPLAEVSPGRSAACHLLTR